MPKSETNFVSAWLLAARSKVHAAFDAKAFATGLHVASKRGPT